MYETVKKDGTWKGVFDMKTLKVAVFLALGLTLTACGTKTEETDQNTTFKGITAEEAMDLMETEEDYVILDVRTKEEYDEKHIKGAILVPNETIGNEEILELPDKDQMILVYCRSGNRSKQASEKLAKLGYTNVYEFGGINSWTGEVE